MLSADQQSCQISPPIIIPLPNGWMLSPDSTPPISPKSGVNDDMKYYIISPYKDCATIADVHTNASPYHLANACLIHTNCMIHYPPSLDGHDLKACSMEGIKRGLKSQSDVSFSSPTLVSRTPYSCNSSKDVHEGVKMQATALHYLDVSQGDVKLGQDSDENAGHSVAPIPFVLGTAPTHSEHSVATPSSDVAANDFPCGTPCDTCSIIAPIVPPYGVRGPMQDDPLPVDRNVPTITSNAVIENDPKLVIALAHWTAEWLHLLIVQPHHHKGHRFAYVLASLPLSALAHDIPLLPVTEGIPLMCALLWHYVSVESFETCIVPRRSSFTHFGISLSSRETINSSGKTWVS